MKELNEARMSIIAVLVLMLVSITRRLPEARRLSSGITTLTLAGIVMLVVAGGASAATPITVCQEINVPGDYYLSSDIIDTTTADVCIYITADDVTLDGQGHYIDGSTPGSCSPIGGLSDPTYPSLVNGYARAGIIVEKADNVIVKDVEVKNFCSGILLYGASDNNTVTDCIVHDNGNPTANVVDDGDFNGISVFNRVCNSSIRDNTVYDNTGELVGDCDDSGAGISVKKFSNYNHVTNNTVFGNTFAGIYGKKGGGDCFNTIDYNRVYENGQTGSMSCFTGGIRLQCKSMDDHTIEYNTVRDNIGPGIFVGGNDCEVRNNTVTGSKDAYSGNPGYGLYVDREPVGGNNVEIYDNVICDNEGLDIRVQVPTQNPVGDRNTCGSTQNYGDTGAGAGECTYRCFTVDGHCAPVNDGLAVDIANLATDDKWDADIDTTNDDYSLLLKGEWDPTAADSADIRAGETLRIHACDNISSNERACNVTDHYVTSGEITAGGITENLTLNHFCRNYLTFPYRTWDESDWSGPAVMQMLVDHYRPEEPTQSVLNATGIAHNQGCNADLLYVDPVGMRWTLNDILHNTSSYGGGNYANYGIGNYDTIEDVLHYMCKWHYLGPGAAPAYGDYSNWMVVRGVHTDVKPSFTQGSYEIFGFWINDPKDPGGIGENTYKSVDQWKSTYHLNLTGVGTGDTYYNRYVAVCEPPEDDNVEVTLAKPKPRLADAIIPALTEVTLAVYDTRQPVLEMTVGDEELLKIIKAAIDGVTEELLPYDAEFADVFAKTTAGNPVFVAAESGDYYLVPFNTRAAELLPVKNVPAGIKMSGMNSLKELEHVDEAIPIKPTPIKPIKVENTLIVVLVDSEDGSFMEASWVADPVKYLPVSKEEALKLALGEMDITDKDSIHSLKSKPTIESVYRDASPYYPDWEITIGDEVYFVGQDGTVSQG